MNFLKSLETSASGLYAQRKRMDIIASNLANIETTHTEKGGPYRRKMVVMGTKEIDQDFDKMFNDSVKGVQIEIQKALEQAGIKAEQIDLIIPAGTGIPAPGRSAGTGAAARSARLRTRGPPGKSCRLQTRYWGPGGFGAHCRGRP